MKYVLVITGALFIIAGLVFGISKISSLSDMKEDVEFWESSAKTNFDNYLIEGRYDSLNAAYKSDLTMTVSLTVSGVISGIFFLALAAIIDLLSKLNRKEFMVTVNNESIQPPI